MKRNYAHPESTILLDYGCGGGRDSYALCVEGYKMIAMDYAEEALELVREKCKSFSKDCITVVKNEALEIPLQDHSVDGIIADGSLFLNSKEDITVVVTNLSQVVKNDGLIWANFRTRDDSMYGMGEEIGENLFRLDERTGRAGSTYYFANENDIKDIFTLAGFKIETIDDYRQTSDNRREESCWFHVVGRRK